MIKQVVCVKEYCDETKAAMAEFGITPPVVGKIYNVEKIIELEDNMVGYVLEEYQIHPGEEHWFETVMFRDLQDIELSLDEQIKEALKAPTPLQMEIDKYKPVHLNNVLDAVNFNPFKNV